MIWVALESQLAKSEKRIWLIQLRKVIFRDKRFRLGTPELIGIFKCTVRGLKNHGKWLWLNIVISKIFKPHSMVFMLLSRDCIIYSWSSEPSHTTQFKWLEINNFKYCTCIVLQYIVQDWGSILSHIPPAACRRQREPIRKTLQGENKMNKSASFHRLLYGTSSWCFVLFLMLRSGNGFLLS